MSKKDMLKVALDVGTYSVTALVARIKEDGVVDYIAKGESEIKGKSEDYQGVKFGSVVNMERTTISIRKALEEAERSADASIKSVLLGLSGKGLESMNNTGKISVRGRKVVQTDIDKVIDLAKEVTLPSNRKIVHVEVIEFTVDDRNGIKNPRGMAGKTLEVEVHIITASSTMLQDLTKSVEDAGVRVEDVIPNTIASSYAVLEEDEKKLDVVLLDVGEGTTDIAVFRDGKPVRSAVFPMGGHYITRDICHAMRIPPDEADRIKKEHGSAIPDSISDDDEVEVSTIGSREKRVKKVKFLANVILARVTDIMQNMASVIDKEKISPTSAIVITGGTANLRYITAPVEEVLKYNVRIGKPVINIDDLSLATELNNPEYSAAVGMIQYHVNSSKMPFRPRENGACSRFWKAVSEMLRNFFE
ncbi:MAG: cell division protein FtsA [bacterium]